ncbi:MAG: Rieske 2Fe-2S domain-containing protein [Planctomycetota bacterium]
MNAPETRRRFLSRASGALLGLITVATGLPVFAYLLSPLRRRQDHSQWVSLGPIEMYPVGADPGRADLEYESRLGYRVQTETDSAWVVRESESEATVLSKRCTHLACNVSWKSDQACFRCPCHGGKFDRAGVVIAGPPPEPLQAFESRIQDGELQIKIG